MLRHFFLQLIAEGNCVSKFKVAAVALRLSRNEAPQNQVHTGLAEQVGHWKMVSDDIGIEEPKLIRLANPNHLNFEGLEHLLPKGLLKASCLQKSGSLVSNILHGYLGGQSAPSGISSEIHFGGQSDINLKTTNPHVASTSSWTELPQCAIKCCPAV